ncbi:hypothetical protein [Streptomyces sp. AK02-01A]|uniref:hypothetical protein n=1 Tax=Streptomyces sp. AK02-01A TaxID=3028648 RepID=UPI0029A53782|nr:hypothetical protein [Streptomyces sp. AK02-01A]MDX3849500.1 hypothetical protein [Streptomyces sp. AK02-01A]MDX3849930.1 hypothetical protein [Streptomyces sp. AK02-01A]
MAFLLLLFVPAGLILAFAFAGHGFGTLGRVGLRSADRRVWLRSLAAILGAVAIALYTWGLLHVVGAVMSAADGGADSAPIRSCRTPGWQERTMANMITDYTVNYLPLQFVCETNDGGDYATGAVPGYVNPAVLGFALAAVIARAGAPGAERRTEKDPAV